VKYEKKRIGKTRSVGVSKMKIPWLKIIGMTILTAFALAVIVFSGAFLIWVQFQ